MTQHACRAAAYSLVNLGASSAAAVVLLALTLPVLGVFRGGSLVDASLENLQVLGFAHALYAFEWNGSQPTVLPANISSFGNSPQEAYGTYQGVFGDPPAPLVAGSGGLGLLWGYFNSSQYALQQPIDFGTSTFTGFGSFRLANARPLHEYIDGRFHGQTFFAPQDDVVMPIVEPAFESPFEFVEVDTGTLNFVLASYVHSPAALFDPAVMRSNAEGGFVDPWSIDTGFAVPPLESAFYPDLKTHMLEHHWLQNRPADVCNPFFEPGNYNGCEPYYFNHGIDSAPATLFYDGHTELLPNSAVEAADATVLEQTGGTDGLWHRGTPFGVDGYFTDASFDGLSLSHHVLTTDGMQGRDTLAGMPTRGWRPTKRRHAFAGQARGHRPPAPRLEEETP